jgi:GNAT superfamily N-acetyltransferase
VHPDFEGCGIGRALHDTMLDWYFSQRQHTLWLSTAPGTRAEQFYRLAGWQSRELQETGELKFEMEPRDWLDRSTN